MRLRNSSGLCLLLVHVSGGSEEGCAGRCHNLPSANRSWDLHWQPVRMERGSAYMLHLTFLKYLKHFLRFWTSSSPPPHTSPQTCEGFLLSSAAPHFVKYFSTTSTDAFLSHKTKRKCWFAGEGVSQVLLLLYLCTRHGCHYQHVANLTSLFGIPQVQQERCGLTRKILFLIKHILAIGNASLSLERIISFMWSCFLRARKRSYRSAHTGNSL